MFQGGRNVVLFHDQGDIKWATAAWEDFMAVKPTGARADHICIQMEEMKNTAKLTQLNIPEGQEYSFLP